MFCFLLDCEEIHWWQANMKHLSILVSWLSGVKPNTANKLLPLILLCTCVEFSIYHFIITLKQKTPLILSHETFKNPGHPQYISLSGVRYKYVDCWLIMVVITSIDNIVVFETTQLENRIWFWKWRNIWNWTYVSTAFNRKMFLSQFFSQFIIKRVIMRSAKFQIST